MTSGLGGMSGAQPKAGNIAGCITVCAEVNPVAANKRHEQGWVDELFYTLDELTARVKQAITNKQTQYKEYPRGWNSTKEYFINNGTSINNDNALYNTFI